VTDREQIETGPGRLVVRSVPLGGSAMSRAVQSGDVGADWYAARPATAAGWRAHAEQVRAASGGADWLTALAPAIAATGRAADRLARASHDGVVVTTGQQPGLFGGPTYTWSKAITALAFADELELAIGMPVAPIFWAASDDADWMEAAVTYVATARGLHALSLTGPPTEGRALADVPLGDLQEVRALLDDACGSAADRSVTTLISDAYVPHATMGASYVHLLRGLLEPLGIAVLDASHPALRAAADGFLRQALVHSASVAQALATRTGAIEAAGFHPQVDVVDALSLVFHSVLTPRDGSIVRLRERVPVADAARVAREAEVGTLGANVLLRPVLERALLPTLCYLAGPGELAYFAQVAPVAEALNAAVPVVGPRWACEIIDHDVLGLIARRGVTETMLRDAHAAEQHVARALLDDSLHDTLERLRVTIDAQLRALHETIGDDDAPVPSAVVDGLSRDLMHRLDRFDRRVLAGVKRRETDAMREVSAMRAAVRPMGQSPERVLNLMPMLARYGVGVLNRMMEVARPHAHGLVHGESSAP